jgi:tetratricopeptide (TPR) repeat protein
VAGRPVANLSFAINYTLAPQDVRDVFEASATGSPSDAADRLRRNAWGYHAANLLIHLASALLLFGIVRRTLLTDRLRPTYEAAAPWVAASAALLWVVHPLTTAAVTYIVQRVESLMSLFFLLALYWVIRASEGGRRRAWAALAVASCALGMATKETMVGAPLVAGAWLRLFARPAAPDGRRLLLAGLASTWLVLAVLILGERRGPSIGLDAGIAWRYLLTQADVITHYVGLAVAPTSLAFLYDWPLVESAEAVLPRLGLLAGLVVVHAVGLWRRWPAAFPGIAFFVVLAPSSSVLPIVTEVAAEHRMYLPLAAIVALAVAGGYLALLRVIGSGARAAAVVAIGALAAAGVLGVETRARNRDYWSEEALWRDTVVKRPADPRPRVAYGDVLMRTGRIAEAEAQFRAALERSPADAVARVRLGAALARQGKVAEAVALLEPLASPPADDPAAHRLLGELYAAQGREGPAVRHLERALPRMADDPELLARLAALLADSRDESVRDPSRAVSLAARAVALTSGRDARAQAVLAFAQARSGRTVEAARAQGASQAFIAQLEALARTAEPRDPQPRR